MLRASIRTARRSVAVRTNKISTRMSSTTDAPHSDAVVVFSNKDNARLIHLNRLNKLNSLNTEMVSLITPRLVEYAKSTSSNVVILGSNSPKALCAGGDVAECARQIISGNPGYGADFFQKEYNLNYLIATYSKPYVALMHGITMGGGVGLSVHAPFRVATETTRLAMPEMDIGFFPDVGTTFFLPRLDDKLGYYYALTGEVMSGLDAYFTGFATHYVPSDRLPQLVNRLSNLTAPVVNNTKTVSAEVIFNSAEYFAQVNQAIEEFTENKLPESYVPRFSTAEVRLINTAFSQKSVEEIFDYLKKEGSAFSTKLAETLSQKPLSSLKVAFELLNKGAENSLRQQFELELISATNIMNIPVEKSDFVKGVSHKLLEKIKSPANPAWNNADATDSYVKTITAKSIATTKYLETPLLNAFFGVNYKQYPYNMGLPNNSQIAAYITGTDGSNRAYLPTPKEVLKHFSKQTNGKLGVELKVQTVLDLHGEASKYDNKYVSWKN